MALLKSVKTPHGFDAQNAYHRVECVSLSAKTEITFHLRSYKGSDHTVAFGDVRHSCQYVMNEENPVAQAYKYLKTLPEFSDAEDV